jgi:acetylornithine/succinyldiaminopimelate/putrescine aminotransferase
MSTTPALNPTIKALLGSLASDRAFVRGQGTRLTDAAGREYLDCWAQYGVLALGHNPPAVVAAVRDALGAGTPAFVQPYRAPHAEALAEELIRRAPAGLTRCLFTNSGAETVEAAIKLTRAATGRTRVLSTDGAYHGSTYGAMAASGQREYREGFGPLPAGFDTVPYGDAEALDERLDRDGGDIAAFIVEPIQGRRGAHAPPTGYLARARQACTRHGVALVADEIQTGLGRTGTLFACEREAVAPDVLLVAKALGGGLFPLGACLASDRLWSDDFALRHLSTFANNNLACLAGIITLRELDRLQPALPEKAARLYAALVDLAARHREVVREVRVHGLLAAIELYPPSPPAATAFGALPERALFASRVAAAIAEQESVLVLPAVGEANVLRIIPPLVMEAPEIDRGVAAIDAVFTRLARGRPG